MDDVMDLSTGDATLLSFRFTDIKLADLEQALGAPICEFVRPLILFYLQLNAHQPTTGMHSTFG